MLPGLVDSDSEEDFYIKFASLENVWNECKKPFLSASQEPVFFTYITDKACMIVDNMLANTCTNAGLGNPPLPFCTNVLESGNSIIKRAVNFKESEMANFTLKMAQLIKRQTEDVQGALLNSGPLQVRFRLPQFPTNNGKVVIYVNHTMQCIRKTIL
ncbi:Hypothetical predicted protein [Paramuricea clavata]|uniref:Uncharacterized protein n=1 Tax=Paramuricea clavata TaxID=317549 RepID=A0A6S7FPN9_PARCT|nr:Hypothetical predicted protein [Paramuricea clavata]